MTQSLLLRVARVIDRGIRRLVALAAWLSLPLSLLLFLQWPLREWLHAYSREANDLAQILFALYVSVAVTAATRSRDHLAADAFAQRYAPSTRRALARVAAGCILLPWAAFVTTAAYPIVANAVAAREGFPETFNPGYFVIKIAAGLLGLLVGLEALRDVLRADPPAP